jgi:exodeoxyribonuclease-3
MQQAGSWIDVMRAIIPEPAKHYTGWSYRAADWAASDRGRLLDHSWASPAHERAAKDMKVEREARGWERPSDHVPVLAAFEL